MALREGKAYGLDVYCSGYASPLDSSAYWVYSSVWSVFLWGFLSVGTLRVYCTQRDRR
jgi:hypothetical protein